MIALISLNSVRLQLRCLREISWYRQRRCCVSVATAHRVC